MIDQHVLYLDNVRGFENTYVPLTDVSFLVGENSTGKTSVLKLLNLLADPRFLLLPHALLADEENNLSTWSDLTSERTLRIGMIRRSTDKDGLVMPLGALVTYGEQDGQPIDTHFTCTVGTQEIAIKRIDRHVYARVRPNAIDSKADIRSLFGSWIKEQSAKAVPAGYQLLDMPKQLRGASLFYPLSQVAKESGLVPRLFDVHLAWLAPVRSKPRRTYDEAQRFFAPEGAHTPTLIRTLLLSRNATQMGMVRALENFGKNSGLFRTLATREFGKGDAAPFQLQIVLDKRAFNVTNVGYGVSQALPIVVEVLCRDSGSWFAIQQPEVHLHPRAQAALGDFVFEFASSQNKKFLIETHSDFMIDRYRISLRKSRSKKKPSSQILFFERRNGKNTVTPLAITDSGELPVDQPKSYRHFFIKEQMDMLEL
ncbi:MAG: AAA family ATPase [Bryobacteraceae bacterium]